MRVIIRREKGYKGRGRCTLTLLSRHCIAITTDWVSRALRGVLVGL